MTDCLSVWHEINLTAQMSKLMYSVELKMEVPHTSSLDGKKKNQGTATLVADAGAAA